MKNGSNPILGMLGVVLPLSMWTQGPVTHLVDEMPVHIRKTESGIIVADFGRVAFGNIRLMPPADAHGAITVHFGEAFSDGRVNRSPPGTVRYQTATVSLDGDRPVIVAPPRDSRNTETADSGHPPAILTPSF